MLKRRPKSDLPELNDPGESDVERDGPGSIEQQLDMCETGELRGDEILHSHGDRKHELEPNSDPLPVDILMGRFSLDISEPDREGAEMTGDEHSRGLQGEESELMSQPHIDSGIPGEETEDAELKANRTEVRRRRA